MRFVVENLGYSINYIQDKKQIKLSQTKDDIDIKDTRIEVQYDGSPNFSKIKESTAKEVESQEVITNNGGYVEIRYVKNQIIFLANKEATFEQIKEIVGKYDGVIVGYIARTHRYQVEFLECTYDDLQNKIKRLCFNKLLKFD